MGRHVDPDQWSRDVETSERRIGERRIAERRRRDRLTRWLERFALLVMVVLYILGFRAADHQRKHLRENQTRIAHQARQIAKVTRQTNRNRVESVSIFCRAINHDRRVLRSLIIDGTKQGRAFEDVYRSHHFPAYRVRLAQARAAAARLNGVPCAKLVEGVVDAGRAR